MTSLNIRQVEFIKLLLEEKEYKTINYFARRLKISDKTIQKDLNVIEKYLSRFNVILYRKPGTGIMISKSGNEKCLLHNSLQIQQNEVHKYSIHERRIEIIKYMLRYSDKTTSIQKLSDKYYVSKTSIANDFKYIEEWLSQFRLKLNKNVEGTKIEGAEIDFRRGIAFLLLEYSKEEDDNSEIQNLVTHLDFSTLDVLSELFEKEKIIYVNGLLVELEKKYCCKLYDPYYINLLTHILISLTRGAEGKEIEVERNDKLETLKQKKAYIEAQSLVRQMNYEFNINLDESEIYYLYQYFISSGLIKNESENDEGKSANIKQLAEVFAKELTTNMERIMQIHICNDETIMEGLLLHIRPMINRLNYDIQITNSLMGNIELEYPELLAICKAAVLLTSHKLSIKKKISMDEIGYITLYYQLALERSSMKKRVLVVCHSGYGTSQLLTTRLKRSFPQWDVVDIISSNRLCEYCLEGIEFIVSTVPLEMSQKPYILVSAFLNDQDIKNISNIITKRNSYVGNRNIGTQCISQYIKEENIYINYTEEMILNELNSQYCTRTNYQKIVLSKELIIYIEIYSKTPMLAVSLNENVNSEIQLVFYMAMSDTNEMVKILSEVYHIHNFGKYTTYLKKCREAKDIINYFKMNKGEERAMETKLGQVIKSETIKLDMKATNKNEALSELTELLRHTGALTDTKAFLKDVYYRETLGCTGIGNGIAIPHGKSKFVNRTALAFGKTSSDIEWETLDGKPVRFIILFAVTEKDKDSAHIRLLSQVATKLGDDGICEQLLKASTSEEVYQIFAEE